MTPQSAVAGSRLGTIDILIDDAVVDDMQLLKLFFNQFYFPITHNNSGEELLHVHFFHSSFRLVANNTISKRSSFWGSEFNSSSLAKIRDVQTDYCTHNSTKFLILSLDIILQSDSLYYLGVHSERIHGDLSIPNTDLQSFSFETTLKLIVQAG